MKKLILITLFAGFSGLCLETDAQKLYLNIKTGYGLKAGALNHEYGNAFTMSENGDWKEETLAISYGKGIQTSLGAGYQINEVISVELDFSYLHGSSTTLTQKPAYNINEYVNYGRLFQLVPSLVLNQAARQTQLYSRFGIILVTGRQVMISDEKSILVEDHTESVLVNSGGIGIGLHTGAGCRFPITEKMGFFTELNLNLISYTPSKGEYTKYNYNGENMLHSMSTSAREIEYTPAYTESGASDPNQPRKEVLRKFPFHNFGLLVGLRFDL